jgi:hypothetical protein
MDGTKTGNAIGHWDSSAMTVNWRLSHGLQLLIGTLGGLRPDEDGVSPG